MASRTHENSASSEVAEHPRELPASVETERCILGALVLDAMSYVEAVGSKLLPDHFSLDAHRRIYSAIIAISESGRMLDLVTLVEELKRSKELEASGGIGYVSSLTEGMSLRTSIGQHIRMVKDKALLRGIVHLATSMNAAAFEQSDSGADLLDIMEQKIADLRTHGVTLEAEHASSAIVNAIEKWREIRAIEEGDVVGLTTGIAELDRLTTGIRRHEYWVVGARPSAGKTLLLMQIALANAMKGVRVGVFSEEMSTTQLMFRCMAHLDITSSASVRDPRYMSDGQFHEARASAIEKIGVLPLWIWKGQRSVQDVSSEARLAIAKHGIELLIVDYLQITEAPGRNGFERVTNVSRGLDKLIDKTGVPIVTASQLNRDAKDPKRKPQLGDLRESGQIEQDADVVILIYRESNEHDEPTDEGQLLIAKQREGVRGHVNVTFDQRTLTFVEQQPEPAQPEQMEMNA